MFADPMPTEALLLCVYAFPSHKLRVLECPMSVLKT